MSHLSSIRTILLSCVGIAVLLLAGCGESRDCGHCTGKSDKACKKACCAHEAATPAAATPAAATPAPAKP